MSKENTALHTPPLTPTRPQGNTAPSTDSDLFKEAIKHILSLASCSEVQIVSALTKETAYHQEQIRARENELAKLRKQLREEEERKSIAVGEMFTAMEKEKAKVTTAETEKETLRKTMANQETELEKNAQLLKKMQIQVDTLRAQRSKDAMNAVKASNDISELQKKLKEHEAAMDKLKTAESSAQALLSAERTKNTELEKARAAASEGLETAKGQLQKLEGFRVGPSEATEESMVDEFSNLWDYATAQMSRVLAQDLDGAFLNDKSRWDKLRKAGETAVWYRIPVLASNTPAAKGMRLVVLLAILARAIDKYIFLPNYLLAEGTELRDIFNQLAEADGARESFCRSVLLSVNQAAQEKSLKSQVQSVVRNVSFYFCDLLSEAQYDNLRQVLENVANRACNVWRPIQRAEKKYEPDFDPLNWGDAEWSPFKIPGQEPGLSSTNNQDSIPADNLLTVFPRICQIDGGGRSALSYAIQIRKSHQLYLDAEEEVARKSTFHTAGRRPSINTRRRSVTTNTPNLYKKAFLGKTNATA
ncbi:hypothetical protein BJX70DRAFT_401731 [Aspergillus crustosus]